MTPTDRDALIERVRAWATKCDDRVNWFRSRPDWHPRHAELCEQNAADLRALISLASPSPAETESQFARHPMETAPKRHQPVWLLLNYQDPANNNAGPLEDSVVAWTLGHNGYDDTGEDYWQAVSWSWEQDCYHDAERVLPLAWCPIGGKISEDERAAPAASPSPAQWPEDVVEALKQSREGWNNVIELGLIPERHRLSARILADKCASALATLPPPAEGVATPQNADQAAMMALLGEKWLREHAPERLLPPPEDERVKGLDQGYNAVREFHVAFDVRAPTKPAEQTDAEVTRRADWIAEEVQELRDAKTLEDQADAYIDILYFALGGMVELGIHPAPLFEIVHSANMAKLHNGVAVKRPDGKIIKPDGWTAPEPLLRAEIARQTACAPIHSVPFNPLSGKGVGIP